MKENLFYKRKLTMIKHVIIYCISLYIIFIILNLHSIFIFMICNIIVTTHIYYFIFNLVKYNLITWNFFIYSKMHLLSIFSCFILSIQSTNLYKELQIPFNKNTLYFYIKFNLNYLI